MTGVITYKIKLDGGSGAIGTSELQKQFEKLADAASRLAGGQTLTGGIAAASDEAERILRDTESSVLSRVARLAAVYRRAGTTLSDAFRLAWADVKAYTADAYGELDKYLSGLDEIRRYPAATKSGQSYTYTGSAGGLDELGDGAGGVSASFSALGDAISRILGEASAELRAFSSSVRTSLDEIVRELGRVDLTVIINGLDGVSAGGLIPLIDLLSDALISAIRGASAAMSELWHGILVPAGQFVSGAFYEAFCGVRSLLGGSLTAAADAASTALSLLRDRALVPLADFIRDGFSSSADGMKRVLTSLLSFVSSVFADGWRGAWENVTAGMSGAFSSSVSRVRAHLNEIIGFINKLTAGAAESFGALIGAANKLSWTVPDWVPVIGGESFGFDFGSITAPRIPYLATGAVIPPRAPFMAVLGDQRRGTNIEAPLSTIEDAVRNVLAEGGASFGRAGGAGEGTYRFTAQINRRTLFDEFIAEAKLRQSATGRDPFALA